MKRLIVPLFALAFALPLHAEEAAPAAVDTFEREALAALKAAYTAKRSVTVHVGGAQVSGLVKAIGPDVVVLANQARAKILVRRERIDAVEAE